MAGGNPGCVHPATKAKMLEQVAQATEPRVAPAPPHKDPRVVAAHLGFDHSKLDAVSSRMRAISAHHANLGDAEAAQHFAHLSVVAEHLRRLSEELVRGIHAGPPRKNGKAGASPLPRGGVI